MDLPLAQLFENLPTRSASIARVDQAALSKPLAELGLSPRVLRLVQRQLDLIELDGQLWSQFHGISYETKVAGHLADWTGAGLATIGHVVEFTEVQWRDVGGLGAKGFTDLAQRLGEHTLALGAIPLRDAEIWTEDPGEAKCRCGEPLGERRGCALRGKVELGPLLSLVRCERIGCVVRSRWELIAAVTAKLRYRMYSLRHAGEPGNVHDKSLRQP